MSFGERAIQRKRTKDLKNEVKQLRKELLSAGCEKGKANTALRELQEAMELGDVLKTAYERSQDHLRSARASIERLLAFMSESPAAEVKESLNSLVSDLDLVYHDCSIRADDPDFKSTIDCLKRMVAGFGEGGAAMDLMLRSELENIKSVLDDASGWKAPDFFALAYFTLHENKDELREMENEQRNHFLEEYLKKHFMDAFLRECQKAGAGEKMTELIRSYIYE